MAPGGANRLPLRPSDEGPTPAINRPEQPAIGGFTYWSALAYPDAGGRIAFRGPRGLKNASVYARSDDKTVVYKLKVEPNGPLTSRPSVQVGVLDDDRSVTVVAYRAATLLVTATADDGHVLDDLAVSASFRIDRTNYGILFRRQADGRYRSEGIKPDQEYRLRVRDRRDAYVPRQLPRVKVPEGGVTELTVSLRKRQEPPEPGRPAPAFSVNTLDGRTLSLDGLRGKTVLLHFWAPNRGLGGAAALKAVHDRFGRDRSFAMIGLCLSDDPAEAAKLAESSGLTWPQAVLRDENQDATVTDYRAYEPNIAFLIGPDRKLIAKVVAGPALEQAVANAVSRK